MKSSVAGKFKQRPDGRSSFTVAITNDRKSDESTRETKTSEEESGGDPGEQIDADNSARFNTATT